jgi:DCN1-like protein 3
MGKCLSRAQKGVVKNSASLGPVAAKDSPHPTLRTDHMGLSASSDTRGQQLTAPVTTSGIYVSGGGGEIADPSIDKNNWQHLSLTTQSPCAEPASGDQALDRRITAFFDCYRDPDAECILADGIERFCNDVGVQPDEFSVLVLAWKFGAAAMCRFTRDEFISGCRALGGTDSPEAIYAQLPSVVAEVMNSRELFRDLYRWSYRFGLDAGQRTLPLAMAISLWRLVFSQNPPPVLTRWLSFLEHRRATISGIMRDTWDMFLLFTETIGDDLERYDESEAWPSLIDDFVEYENDRKNHNVGASFTSVK